MSEAKAALADVVAGWGRRDVRRGTWRERMVHEASTLTRTEGWHTITMARLADRLGVSRQTVYNEIGTKQQLAEALVMRELEGFLTVVTTAFANEPDDLIEAIREAARQVLESAQANPLLHAVISASHGAESSLLPLLTTQSEPVLDAFRAVIRDNVAGYEIAIPDDRLEILIDGIIRLVLSHVIVKATWSAEEVADNVAWVAERVLGSAD